MGVDAVLDLGTPFSSFPFFCKFLPCLVSFTPPSLAGSGLYDDLDDEIDFATAPVVAPPEVEQVLTKPAITMSPPPGMGSLPSRADVGPGNTSFGHAMMPFGYSGASLAPQPSAVHHYQMGGAGGWSNGGSFEGNGGPGARGGRSSEICRDFTKGRCSRGEACIFSHGGLELGHGQVLGHPGAMPPSHFNPASSFNGASALRSNGERPGGWEGNPRDEYYERGMNQHSTSYAEHRGIVGHYGPGVPNQQAAFAMGDANFYGTGRGNGSHWVGKHNLGESYGGGGRPFQGHESDGWGGMPQPAQGSYKRGRY